MSPDLNLLSDLQRKIRDFNDSSNVYFNYIGKYELLNPTQDLSGSDNEKAQLNDEFFVQLGIRCLATTSLLENLIPPNILAVAPPTNLNRMRWHSYKNISLIEHLKEIFRNCRIVEFKEWSLIDGASDLWDGLRFDVIKPINKKDLNFLFTLGDPTKKLAFEVDEILDIMSDFSHNGQVSLILSEHEALKLWLILHGQDEYSRTPEGQAPDLSVLYQSIFKSMSINTLLILEGISVTAVTDQQQFTISRRSLPNVPVTKELKDQFSAGYSLGLLLQLDLQTCITLGLTAGGSFLDEGHSPDRIALIDYLERWIQDMDQIDLQMIRDFRNTNHQHIVN